MKGQLTIPNLAGVIMLLFVFSILFNPIKSILIGAASGANPLTAAVVYSIPAIILIGILASPFMLAQKKFEREQRKRMNTR